MVVAGGGGRRLVKTTDQIERRSKMADWNEVCSKKLEEMTFCELLNSRQLLVDQYAKTANEEDSAGRMLPPIKEAVLRQIEGEMARINAAINARATRVSCAFEDEDAFQMRMEFFDKIALNENEIPF